MAVVAEKVKTFTAGAALAAYRRVRLSVGSGISVVYAGVGEESVGVTEAAAASGALVAVRLWGGYSTYKLTASGAVTAGAYVYSAASGKVSATAAGAEIAMALEACAADGEIIEVTRTYNRGGGKTAAVAAGAALTASSTETALGSYTIPADTLKAGDVIKVRFQGLATATNSTDTLQIKLYIGGLSGTALLTGTATDVANNDFFTGEALIVIRTIGASGTFVATASGNIVPAATAVAVPVLAFTASTAIDTTATQAISVSGKWSTTNAGNSCRLDILVVERV